MLIVGYGNPLRGDDGVGQEVAEVLAVHLAGTGASTVLAHQLLPELALDASRSQLVVFIDAAVGEPAGSVSVQPLTPVAGPPADPAAAAARATSTAGAFSHQLGAADVLALARDLYGACPEAVLVRVGSGRLELGAGLSAAVRGAVPRAAQAVLAAIDVAQRAGGACGEPAKPMTRVPYALGGGTVHQSEHCG